MVAVIVIGSILLALVALAAIAGLAAVVAAHWPE